MKCDGVAVVDGNVDDAVAVLRLVAVDDSDVRRAVKIADKHDVTIAEKADDSSFLKLLYSFTVQVIFFLYE